MSPSLNLRWMSMSVIRWRRGSASLAGRKDGWKCWAPAWFTPMSFGPVGLIRRNGRALPLAPALTGWRCRSEEHTFELQSLMSITYAVVSLNKKQYQKTTNYYHNYTQL